MKIRRKSNEPRNTVLTIRLSNAEKTELKKRASNSGLSVGAFLIDLALDNKKTPSTKSAKNTKSSNSTKSTPATRKRTYR